MKTVFKDRRLVVRATQRELARIAAQAQFEGTTVSELTRSLWRERARTVTMTERSPGVVKR
jgi:hypothetical protein